MIKTYNDLILACESFSYSKEYYEMMKEAAEIDLMNIYVANQEYMAENAEAITESANVLDDYFQEAVSGETIKNIAKTAATKTANLAKKIWAKIKQVLKAIGNFFKKFKLHSQQRIDRLLLFKDMFKAGIKGGDDVSTLTAICSKYENKLKTLTIAVKTYDGSGVVNFADLASDFGTLTEAMVGALTRKYINIRSLKGKAAEPTDLSKLLKYVMKDAKKAEALIKKIEDKDLIQVPLFDDKIDGLKKVIDGIIEEIDAAIEKDTEVLGSDEIDEKKTAATDRIALLNQALQMAGATLNAYSEVDKMLSIMADAAVELKKYFEEKKAWDKKEKAEAKEDKKLAKEEAKYDKKQAKQQAKEDKK